MLTLDNVYATAFWQPFPLWMYVAHKLYIAVRPSTSASGYVTTQFTYGLVFLISTALHVYYMGPIILAQDHAAYNAQFVPSWQGLPITTKLPASVLDFIQWDIVFVSVSTFLASLWTVESFLGALGVVAWFVVSSVAFGPGAALAGVYMYREGALNSAAGKRNKKE